MSEVQVRAMAAARLGLPLVSYHVLQPNLAFCSQLPGRFIDIVTKDLVIGNPSCHIVSVKL